MFPEQDTAHNDQINLTVLFQRHSHNIMNSNESCKNCLLSTFA